LHLGIRSLFPAEARKQTQYVGPAGPHFLSLQAGRLRKDIRARSESPSRRQSTLHAVRCASLIRTCSGSNWETFNNHLVSLVVEATSSNLSARVKPHSPPLVAMAQKTMAARTESSISSVANLVTAVSAEFHRRAKRRTSSNEMCVCTLVYHVISIFVQGI
jgi:hypothetical protein